ncbi:alpha-(1,3)-fucosyltransferase C-like [Leguminivora glycinivorella]|uniref:alpha-(1,3)-fucosyltransferase C-like n=1 Tax=Leguminivora glycinivorella TaxID=1035111 RepID=UPI00200D87E1|nr:alpha-(1,3)-fucosyltransferase C-like [Leguminivora glycinivorella]
MKHLVKVLILASFLFVILFLYVTLREWTHSEQRLDKLFQIGENWTKHAEKPGNSEPKLKYILQWTNPRMVPFVYMGVGQQTFIERKCQFTNCYVTSDRSFLGDVSKFDVIAFSGTDIIRLPFAEVKPKIRSPHQKYAFTNIESADNYPVCSYFLDNFFNWTWTYRLDSETKWGYIIVRDANNNVIGPKKNMHWMRLEDMDSVSEELSMELKNKSRAAAWFVSNCHTRSGREKYVMNLQKELRVYNLSVDVYGLCGPYNCSRDNEEACFQKIKTDYYFYLSFENSLSEDYVTEKLLSALKYNAIPIVYGGANYTRFMPDGIYLDARKLGPAALAREMKYLIDNPDQYEQYFRWKNHYSYYRRNDNPETDDYCGFCALLNNDEMVKRTSIYEKFKYWWNDPNGRCF